MVGQELALRKGVCVVGAGIIGLCTAKKLVDEGFDVSIIARETVFTANARCHEKNKQPYTSSAAGGLWWPFHLGPDDKVEAWGTRTFQVLEVQSECSLCGVNMEEGFLLHAKDSDEPLPWYAKISKMEKVTPAEDVRIPSNYSFALRMTVPVVQSDIYLAWLHTELVDIHRVEVESGLSDWSFESVTSHARTVLNCDVVVNCTGVGAREFVGDKDVYGARGALLIGKRTEAQGDFKAWYTELENDGFQTSEDRLSYAFPRGRNRVILGGLFQPNNSRLDVSDDEVAGLRSRVGAVVPCLEQVEEITRLVGLRPVREKGVRLEVDASARVVHNYGHGGGGFTTCWGCAEDVVEKVKTLV